MRVELAHSIISPAAGYSPRHEGILPNLRDIVSSGFFEKESHVVYAPKAFQPSRSASLAFAAARGFGTICTCAGGRPVAAAVPFCMDSAADGTPLLAFHVARRNPLVGCADSITPWLLAVNGADAYVSADWYASPDQVPTWLYQAVHLTGTVQPMPDDEMGEHLDLLSARSENRLLPKPPWTSAKMTAGRLDAMKKAIVGLVMTVDEVEGSFKLNQHKSEADQIAVGAALARQDDCRARTIAAQMLALRSHANDTSGAISVLAG